MEREEALERLKKKRTILRTSLSKYGKRIEEYDVHKECDHEELLGQLSDVYEELRRVDEEIVIVAVYACGVNVEKGPIRQQL
ncbi:hypothetical protein LAZ67_8003790 [Cordylochernes scorpioides]|uniref:Uncharacterized protein n=1 Tax=Cordylochernes scorpioides TaxID=51811 RepID=A0ABY6KSJ6_9ARAC|nr:hypothetical protein LAZ67_8003790 [Cordylochernes scorpioides]